MYIKRERAKLPWKHKNNIKHISESSSSLFSTSTGLSSTFTFVKRGRIKTRKERRKMAFIMATSQSKATPECHPPPTPFLHSRSTWTGDIFIIYTNFHIAWLRLRIADNCSTSRQYLNLVRTRFASFTRCFSVFMPNANGLLIPISRALFIILLLKEASFPASFLSSSKKGEPNENDNNNIHEQ